MASSSLGTLLESRGFSVAMVKIDPYLNVDAGTMSPYQHGEVFVTADGSETDLDLGNYARFTSSELSAKNSITTGQIFQRVIDRERQGKYLGKCVQVVPHITDEIKRRIRAIGEEPNVDITIVEVGGTVGDIESIPFLEAMRQFIKEVGHSNALSVHLTLVPTVAGGEVKTKPTQHSVKDLREIGIQADVLLCRCDEELPADLRKKISMFTNIDEDAVLSAHNVSGTIYEIPIIYHKQGFDTVVCKKLQLAGSGDAGGAVQVADFAGSEASSACSTGDAGAFADSAAPLGSTENPTSQATLSKADLSLWQRVTEVCNHADKEVTIAMVGKYIELGDAYKSIDEALMHGAIANGVKLKLVKIDAESLESKDADIAEILTKVDGIIVPGGFGSRGILGMIQAAEYARTQKIPYLGVCLGMQIMVIEYARNVLGLAKADSSEFRPEAEHKVVSLLEEQVDIANYGGTMRLGRSLTVAKEGTLLHKAYGSIEIWERHRHRYEVANAYREELQAAGLIISGTTKDNSLVEAVEWSDHPWAVGVQAHPEFTSKPTAAGPLFRDFIQAAIKG